MRAPCCHSFLSFLLKFLHFLQTFAGISLILYSIYLLNQWNHHHSTPHHPIPAPSPANFDGKTVKFGSLPVLDRVEPLKLFGEGFEVVSGEKLNSVELPAPWYMIFTLFCVVWMYVCVKFRFCNVENFFVFDNLCCGDQFMLICVFMLMKF